MYVRVQQKKTTSTHLSLMVLIFFFISFIENDYENSQKKIKEKNGRKFNKMKFVRETNVRKKMNLWSNCN